MPTDYRKKYIFPLNETRWSRKCFSKKKNKKNIRRKKLQNNKF